MKSFKKMVIILLLVLISIELLIVGNKQKANTDKTNVIKVKYTYKV